MPLHGFARFSEPAVLVLLSLLDGPKHGYAITEDLARLTGRRLGPGTLYGAIGQLERRGLIEALAGDGRRKPYRITPAGLEEVRLEVHRLDAITGEARRRLRLGEAFA